MPFNDQISTWVAKVKVNSKAVATGVGREVLSRVKERTPVDTGALKAAWSMEDKGDSILISNPLPYVLVVEYGGFPNPPAGGNGKTSGGFSTQAPAGMVGITIAEIPQIIKEVTDKL